MLKNKIKKKHKLKKQTNKTKHYYSVVFSREGRVHYNPPPLLVFFFFFVNLH